MGGGKGGRSGESMIGGVGSQRVESSNKLSTSHVGLADRINF